MQLKCRLSTFFFASDYTLSGGKASTASVTCISNPRNAPSFSDRLSSLPNCLREAETREREVEGRGRGLGEENVVPPAAVDNSVSLFLAARGVPSQGAVCRSSKNQRCAAAGKYVRCECERRLWLWAEVSGEGGGRHFSSGSVRSYVLRFCFSLNTHNNMSQQVKRKPKQCFQQMRSQCKREFGQEYEGKSK